MPQETITVSLSLNDFQWLLGRLVQDISNTQKALTLAGSDTKFSKFSSRYKNIIFNNTLIKAQLEAAWDKAIDGISKE